MGEFGETGEPTPSSSSKGDDLLAMMDALWLKLDAPFDWAEWLSRVTEVLSRIKCYNVLLSKEAFCLELQWQPYIVRTTAKLNKKASLWEFHTIFVSCHPPNVRNVNSRCRNVICVLLWDHVHIFTFVPSSYFGPTEVAQAISSRISANGLISVFTETYARLWCHRHFCDI